MSYTKKYWEYQKNIGSNSYHSNYVKIKFQKHISEEDTVLDFGCGGGFILNELNCKSKYGIEINSSAIVQAKTFGISIFPNFETLKNNFFDIIISNSALEHILNPADVLKECYRVLKPGGKIIFSVPHEELSFSFKIGDINQHLYTWSPMSAGNLIQHCGFEIIDVKVTKVIQPLYASIIYKFSGINGYVFFGKIYRYLRYLISPFKTIGVSADIIIEAYKK